MATNKIVRMFWNTFESLCHNWSGYRASQHSNAIGWGNVELVGSPKKKKEKIYKHILLLFAFVVRDVSIRLSARDIELIHLIDSFKNTD